MAGGRRRADVAPGWFPNASCRSPRSDSRWLRLRSRDGDGTNPATAGDSANAEPSNHAGLSPRALERCCAVGSGQNLQGSRNSSSPKSSRPSMARAVSIRERGSNCSGKLAIEIPHNPPRRGVRTIPLGSTALSLQPRPLRSRLQPERASLQRAIFRTLRWVNSSSPAAPNSVPIPDCLAPANGMPGSSSPCLLTQTVPDSIRAASLLCRIHIRGPHTAARDLPRCC